MPTYSWFGLSLTEHWNCFTFISHTGFHFQILNFSEFMKSVLKMTHTIFKISTFIGFNKSTVKLKTKPGSHSTILAKIPWNNRKIAFFIPNHHKNYYPPSLYSIFKNLAGNTYGSFVNTLCNIEMGEWGELKSHISIFFRKVDLFQHSWPRLSEFWFLRDYITSWLSFIFFILFDMPLIYE